VGVITPVKFERVKTKNMKCEGKGEKGALNCGV